MDRIGKGSSDFQTINDKLGAFQEEAVGHSYRWLGEKLGADTEAIIRQETTSCGPAKSKSAFKVHTLYKKC